MFGGNSGGGFNELLQEAAKIKGAQMATMRTEFDSWPSFFQNTLFHGQSIDIVKEGRKLPCKERLESAKKVKDEGTAFFKKLDFNSACTKYEYAIAMVHYVYPNRDDWKKIMNRTVVDWVWLFKNYFLNFIKYLCFLNFSYNLTIT